MDSYNITFARSARKELEKLAPLLIHRIFPKIQSLAESPHPKGCKKLQGENRLWRIRIGDYRVVYSVDDHGKNIDIVAIRHRKDIYR